MIVVCVTNARSNLTKEIDVSHYNYPQFEKLCEFYSNVKDFSIVIKRIPNE